MSFYISRTDVGGEERIKESLSARRAQLVPSAKAPLVSNSFIFPHLLGEPAGSSLVGERFLLYDAAAATMGAPTA